MSDFNDLADRYIATWNKPDAEARRAAIASLWTDDGTYTDPLASVAGHDAIAALIGGARDQFPGSHFGCWARFDSHHDIGRFGWELVPEAGGESVVEGSDVAVDQLVRVILAAGGGQCPLRAIQAARMGAPLF